MSKIDLMRYLPTMYKDIKETKDLVNVENELLEKAGQYLERVLCNQFVLTADSEGIAYYESLLHIMPNPDDSIEFRRQRILNRMTIKPPFTFLFLRRKLDELIGTGKWKAYIDYDGYTLYVETQIKNQIWLEELTVTINRIKPCNIVFTNKPVFPSNIEVGEQIDLKQEEFNYRLGIKWILGVKPFSSINEKGAIKMPNVSSISNHTLNTLATHLLSHIEKVRINGILVLSDWDIYEATDNTVVLEYRIDLSHNLDKIEKVELLDSDGSMISSISVYVPVLEPVLLKHTIKVKEG